MNRRCMAGSLIALATLSWLPLAHAGDRELELLVVDMTPDALSTPASSQCVGQIVQELQQGYTHVKRMGETKLRKQTGKHGDSASFLTWKATEFDGPRFLTQDSWFDSAILIDCRPEVLQLDILVVPNRWGAVRMRLRKLEFIQPRLKLIAATLLSYGWGHFSP
jgi:hypothetical protein